MDDTQVKALEEKLKSQLGQLELEQAVFERMVYKNKNQHRRCSYFQYLLKVRRDLRLLRTANMESMLRPCFHVISGRISKQKIHVLESLKLKKSDTGKPNILERLLGALHLLSQMTEPILKAASGISTLLARSFFIGFSVTFLALLARLRVLIQQILLDAVSIFNSVTSTSLKKQSVKIAQDGVEVFREFYPKEEECITLLDCVWKTDKYVLLETLQNYENSKPMEENVSEDATTRDSLVQYQTSVSSLGEDLSPLLEADSSGVTVRKSSTPIAEAASSKTNIGLQPEDSEKLEDVTTRDCSVQYETFVSPLGEDLSPLREADNCGVTVRESSTPIAEAAPSKTNNALQPEDSENPEDATTRDCSIQYQTFVFPLGEDITPSPLPDADENRYVTATESLTPIAEAASSKTNNGSQTEDSKKVEDESTNPVSPTKINRDTVKPRCRATKVAFLPVKRPSSAIMPNTIEERPRKKQETGEKDKKEEDGFYNLLIRGTQKDSLF
ncbi:hypothetical protein ARALYDRAFT_474212 [Arabidopsis lyrata subsp. lyrata]|uniref:Nucleolus and neural progenitor protein-like N-terminal domain-containing protein n=2 Tax=Arabidopsis lyrata subsp. lyrata TaxID=81972 RepID=D7KGU3_ARALL|nr:uncharacterized protein LOC9330344 isoform X1 [Arabidopsis lyrata subsp. lyrata]EFH70542.1 hypothetical protein ARALYDRAFT_474212 [Arabidopsis lyrata subsp. lyrata]|eukprot:XP_020867440.1 uncharacterized protein LOC9330344 isoform X1 [Arabidopsis lyrata subsp. lyrata]